MALEISVTKVWPTLQENGLLYVGVLVVLKDDAVEVTRNMFTEATTKTGDPTLVAQAITTNNHAKYEALRAGVASGLVL